MSAYVNAIEKPYGYLLIDNQTKTPSDKQVVAEVFENCHSYPKITTGTKPAKNEPKLDATIQNPSESPLQSKRSRKCEVERQTQGAKRNRPTKRQKKHPVAKHVKETQRKQQEKKGYTSTLKLSPDRHRGNEKRVNFDKEPIQLTQHQVNAMAKRAVKARGSSFGPKMVYE